MTRPQCAHLLCELRTHRPQWQGSGHLIFIGAAKFWHRTDGSQVAYDNYRCLIDSSEERDERGAECRRSFGEAFAPASCCSSF
jgi:hypothetical protein